MQQSFKPRLWAIVPAAGIGRRFGGERPKQYQSLLGKSVLEHSVQALLHCARIEKVVIVIAPDDGHFVNTKLGQNARVQTCLGGEERFHSVLNALLSLSTDAHALDWVLVHDAARPCLSVVDLEQLICTVERQGEGGILAQAVTDTVKNLGPAGEISTLDRRHLWTALTPQMFRFGPLQQALSLCLEQQIQVTDEAQAMEQAAVPYVLVPGSAQNIKVTQPADLALAEYYLKSRETP